MLVDPAWLRRQVGVVLQENELLNRSVRDNIAFADPIASMDRVIEAAKLAGAHEFTLQLPHGYDSVFEERGRNLSGGQRQRIAIARALMNDPRILILDEGSSALDAESDESDPGQPEGDRVRSNRHHRRAPTVGGSQRRQDHDHRKQVDHGNRNCSPGWCLMA